MFTRGERRHDDIDGVDDPTRERSSQSPREDDLRGSPAIESDSIGNAEGFRWNSFRRTDRDGEYVGYLGTQIGVFLETIRTQTDPATLVDGSK